MSDSDNNQLRRVVRKVSGHRVTEGAGVRVRRFIAGPELSYLDPFLLLDEFRSTDPRDFMAGFPPHPHRGFETVTYMLQGRSKHSDSTGAQGVLEAGDVQWMTAGRGVVHSEMPEPDEGGIWGYQLWVNLPARLKMTSPKYQNIAHAQIPRAKFDGGTVRVIAGQFADAQGVAHSVTDVTYLDIEFHRSARISLPTSPQANGFLLPLEGRVTCLNEVVEPGVLQLLGPGSVLVLEATCSARVLFVAAPALNEPIARGGPFVMNTEAEVVQAFDDYRAGRLGIMHR